MTKNIFGLGLVAALSLVARSGYCGWEGKPFSNPGNSTANAISVVWDGKTCTETGTTMDAASGFADNPFSYLGERRHSYSKQVPANNCAPFIVAARVRDEVGSCTPASKTIRNQSWFGHHSVVTLNLSADCLCYTDESSKDGFGEGFITLQKKFGTFAQCAPFFGEQADMLKQTIEEVDAETKGKK